MQAESEFGIARVTVWINGEYSKEFHSDIDESATVISSGSAFAQQDYEKELTEFFSLLEG